MNTSLITFSSGLPTTSKSNNNNIEYPKCDEQISNAKKSKKSNLNKCTSCQSNTSNQNNNENVWILRDSFQNTDNNKKSDFEAKPSTKQNETCTKPTKFVHYAPNLSQGKSSIFKTFNCYSN